MSTNVSKLNFVKVFIKRILKIFVVPVLWIFRNNGVILLESVPDFADSSKELYDELKRRGYNPVWCTHKKTKGCVFINFRSPVFRFKTMTAKWIFSTHCPLGYKKNKYQTRCFISHGMSFKNTLGFWGDIELFSNVVCLSEFHREIRKIVMPGSESKSIISGYPRNDALFRKTNAARKIFRINENSKIVLWLPTFRHHADSTETYADKTKVKNQCRNDYGNSDRKNEFNLLCEETLAKIDDALESKNVFLIVKFHPSQNLLYVPQAKKYKTF